jgi:predicted Co/Zn/Cd cation transporter (cation efflux family)
VNNKDRFSRIIEKFVNESRTDIMNLVFGTGSKIKIRNIDYSTTTKSIYIDVVVIVGEEVDDLTIQSDDVVVDLIRQSMDYISFNEKLTVTVSYDV